MKAYPNMDRDSAAMRLSEGLVAIRSERQAAKVIEKKPADKKEIRKSHLEAFKKAVKKVKDFKVSGLFESDVYSEAMPEASRGR